MLHEPLTPTDTCGCGDEGYLTTKTIPIDLAHGVGKIHNVPVYHCRAESCTEYNIPVSIARRLEELAETMENTNSLTEQFYWDTSEPSLDPLKQTDPKGTLAAAFTLKFVGREYEDARTVIIVAGQAVFFQSKLDSEEYYALQYKPDINTPGLWFSFAKFYYEQSSFTYDGFLGWLEEGHLKELTVLESEEAEAVLCDEFGEII